MDVTSALRAEMAKAEGCDVLHLGGWGLLTVPTRVWELTTLVRLDLSFNELATLPPAIGQLTRLEELWLNDNPLAALPAELSRCVRLEHLMLDRTQITTLPHELGRLTSLVEVTVEGAPLQSDMAAVYARGGTLGLLALLRHKAGRRELKQALRDVLTRDLYHEAALSSDGRAAIDHAVRACAAAFPDFNDLRFICRNAGRLFPPVLAAFHIDEVRARHSALVRDNRRKLLAADVELKVRAMYAESLDVTRVEGYVATLTSCMPTLEDTEFLLRHATALLPARPDDISGPSTLAAVQALRTKLAEERAAATAALHRAVQALYPDQGTDTIAAVVGTLAAALPRTDHVLALAADAADLLPSDLANLKPKAVLKAFHASRVEKGLR